jgi:hypothetical protein
MDMKTFANASFDELCAFRTDHAEIGDWSITRDTIVVWLSEQQIS